MPEDTRSDIPETPHLNLKPDQYPPPSPDELSAIRALFKGKATQFHQALFITYLMRMCGIGQSKYGTGEFWPFMGGKHWVATTLMALAEVQMLPARAIATLGLELEKDTDG